MINFAAILLGIAKEVAEKTITLNPKFPYLLFMRKSDTAEVPSRQIPEEMICVDMGCVGDDLGCTERSIHLCKRIPVEPAMIW